MTNPLIPEPDAEAIAHVEPEPDPDGETVTNEQVEETQNDNKKYIVKTPWYIDTMTLGPGFEDVVVTCKGVELTGVQRQEAYRVAQESGVTLKSKEVE